MNEVMKSMLLLALMLGSLYGFVGLCAEWRRIAWECWNDLDAWSWNRSQRLVREAVWERHGMPIIMDALARAALDEWMQSPALCQFGRAVQLGGCGDNARDVSLPVTIHIVRIGRGGVA